jgi:NAD(P)-dependent dehydrogenase (short-subunit alcohol dehydrogenase family)
LDLGVDGQVAVITGGARGIGLATARMLAQEGARIALADIDGDAVRAAAAGLEATASCEAVAVPTDISDERAVAALAETVHARLGPPDIVVHCAAILDDKTFLESSPADWKAMLDVCLYGPLLVLRAMLPGMVARGYGRVVCLGSDAGRVGQARLSYYAAAKGGVIAQIKSIAQEVGRHGVTLNVVSPGATNTELREAREARRRAEMGEEKYARYAGAVLKRYPAGRLGEPEDIAAMVAFLASRRAAWITGQVISVNGGFVMP